MSFTEWLAERNMKELIIKNAQENKYPEKIEGRVGSGKFQYRAVFSPIPEGHTSTNWIRVRDEFYEVKRAIPSNNLVV